MNMYKIKISLQSPLGTELMADTIWGHICYGILFNEGEDKLKNFLEQYKNNEPPLILSTPFPENMLPLPKINFKKKEITTIEEYKNIKIAKKIKYIPADKLINNNTIELSELIKEEIKKFNNQNKNEYYFKEAKISKIRNSIDRISGTTKDDSIFQIVEYWSYKIKDLNHKKEYIYPVFDIYVLSSFNENEILNLFKMGFNLGYGADASIGKG
ncbi:MAG: type III-A CRISPR-associated RAMP protein Csm4, partial [Exilispira sp.]